MKRSFLYLSLLAGLVCWGVAPTIADDDDKKLTKAEKRELKKKEKEAKKAAKKKGRKSADDGEEEEDDDADSKKKKKGDKKAVSNAFKKLKTTYGRAKGNGKFFLYADYNLLLEDSSVLLEQLAESDRAFKSAKVNVLLINHESIEEDEAVKSLKKRKIKFPMVMKTAELEEELPGYTPGSAPHITIVDGTGEVKASGGAELLESWHEAIGAKAPKKPKKADDEEETTETAEE